MKLFVPSEFGMPTDADVPGVLGGKYRLKQELRALGVPYTAFWTGLFTDFIFSLPCVLFLPFVSFFFERVGERERES